MTHHRTLYGSTLLAIMLALPAVAQDATATTAVTPEQCEAQFKALDVDANGTLSAVEAPQVYANARVNNVTVDGDAYTHDQYLESCNAKSYARIQPEEGAPFEGANSFTEGQAQDRAISWGVTDVSALTKDDKGVWRGTGKVDGKDMSVAIDFKGNVVTAAK